MTKDFSAQEIATWVDGELVGGNPKVSRVGTLEAGGADAIGFLADSKYRQQLEKTSLGVVLLAESVNTEATQIIVADVRRAWRIVTEKFEAIRLTTRAVGIHPQAIIADDVQLGKEVSVGAGAVVDSGAILEDGVYVEPLAYVAAGVRIGAQTRIGSGARILAGTVIGARCNILSNAVIGERGFGNSFEDGRWLALPQLGGVRIGNDVEVGAGSTVDRGAVGDTVIADGVKLDNLVHIAHNCEVGAHTAMAGCSAIAGSTKVGKGCLIGGASVIAGHLQLADGVQLAGHSSVSKSLTKADLYCSVIPVMPMRQWKRFLAKLRMFARDK